MRLVAINPIKGVPFHLNPDAVILVTRDEQIIGRSTLVYSGGLVVGSAALVEALTGPDPAHGVEFTAAELTVLREALREEAALCRIYPEGVSREAAAGRFLTKLLASMVPGAGAGTTRAPYVASLGACLYLMRKAGHLEARSE